MNTKTHNTLITWVKRILAIIATIAWLGIIFNIAQSHAPFSKQAPYCMGSTMIIFTILSMLYKGLDYLQVRDAS